jgi:hypothetical protein
LSPFRRDLPAVFAHLCFALFLFQASADAPDISAFAAHFPVVLVDVTGFLNVFGRVSLSAYNVRLTLSSPIRLIAAVIHSLAHCLIA